MAIKTFNDVLKYPFVIIFDNVNGNKFHKTSCSFVTEKSFNLKMITNQGKNGNSSPIEYYEDIRDASVVPCKKCKPNQ
jgi:UDP-N-acetylmuramyl tripeptide synthase